ncbi:(2Fe-2S)-binding protein [Mesorhizobium sp. CAU 1741]|uniref:(2Fe-2S)-binding protein n=1 Tax=Mesorhizobium sp. CAU 1741 TaxID=3140366 RepID=UPI00325B3657
MSEPATDIDVLVVGAGPAGIAAAAELDASGLSVLWIDQRDRAGGAIHRQPAEPEAKPAMPPSVRAQWTRLDRRIAAMTTRLHGETSFVGLDGDGLAILEDRRSATTRLVRPRAVIFAVGAVERVLPRPGWQLPGVWTAGGMQVLLKETGKPPAGRILVAGNGPLNIALAAQLAAAGNPPVALLEAGDPTAHPLHGLALLARPRLLVEAMHYLTRLVRARVAWRRRTRVLSIERIDGALRVECAADNGRRMSFDADHVALHDGIRSNGFGLPAGGVEPFIVHAGDCREALGAVAAEADGSGSALEVIKQLGGGSQAKANHSAVAGERKAQAALAQLFRPADGSGLDHLPDETVLCRCEGRTVGELRALLDANPAISPREVKLNGRFAMGACQGRFCADNTAAIIARAQGLPDAIPADALAGHRWPVRPVSIASLLADHDPNPSTSD